MAHFSVHRPAPWTSLFDEFLRDVDPRFDATRRRGVRSRGVYPPVNLEETEEAFVLTAELPGVAPENIDVGLEGKTVTLSGERKIDYSAGDGTAVHRRERQSGHFRRAFELPSEFDLDKAVAKHRNGILELTLPKTPDAKPRQITVQTS